MTRPDVVPLVDPGLGNTAYLVDLGDGRALVVDASRDVRAVRAAAGKRGLQVAFAADTHLHADFLSGARQLAASDGAAVLASAAGHRQFPHMRLEDGEEVDLGGLRLRALATPGHTDEHLSYLLLDGSEPLGVFTGGSLIVGAAARTDLLEPERTEELARAQYRSLRRLATLPDHVEVWPTHGAGSFCSAPVGAERTSTIGQERATNTLLQAPDEDAFVVGLLGSLGSYPAYFRWLAERNRQGEVLLDQDPTLRPLAVEEVRALLRRGAELLDVRPARAFAAAHVPGALSIPLRDAFATWLGWLVSPDRELVVLREPDQDPAEIAWQAAKIGYDRLAGELTGGLEAWAGAGLSTASIGFAAGAEVAGPEVLDVRQRSEFVAGHVPGALHVELGQLPPRVDRLPAERTVVMCAHGERATTAASLLSRAGRPVRILPGGSAEWAAAGDRALETGA